MLVPDSVIFDVKDSNMRLVVGRDEFGCVSLTLGMKCQKVSHDVSLTNVELTNQEREVLRRNFAFRTSKLTPGDTLETLSKLLLIQAVYLEGFENQNLFSLTGDAYVKWKKLTDPTWNIPA